MVTLRWTTEAATIGYVEYGTTRQMVDNTPLETEKATDHSLTLLGLAAGTRYYYRVVSWDGDEAGASRTDTVTTDDLPPGAPSLTQVGEGHDQYTLVPLLGETKAVAIVDPQGEIVWYLRDDTELDLTRVRLSVDGTSLLYSRASGAGEPSSDSEIVRVSLDGSQESSVAIPRLTHDFVEHPDGTLAAIVSEERDFEGELLQEDRIVEVDEDGVLSTVFRAWDCFDPAQVQGEGIESTLANALEYDDHDEAYYLSLRGFSSIVRISRESGKCEWVLGAVESTLDFTEGSEPFHDPLQFDVRGSHILVLDSGSSGDASRVLEYELDLDANEAAEIWSYVAPSGVGAAVRGSLTRLNSGDTFLNWASAGQMEVVTDDGASTWSLQADEDLEFGFHTLASSLYPD